MYDKEGGHGCMEEDCVWPTLGTAKVKWVLPSTVSVQLSVQYCQVPLPD